MAGRLIGGNILGNVRLFLILGVAVAAVAGAASHKVQATMTDEDRAFDSKILERAGDLPAGLAERGSFDRSPTADGSMHGTESIQARDPNRTEWAAIVPEPVSRPLLSGSFTHVIRLYARDGGVFPPNDPFPYVNCAELLQNLS